MRSGFFKSLKSTVPEKKNYFWAIILIGLAVFSVYFVCLPNNFIFDDYHMIVKNNFLKHADSLPQFFKGDITSYPIARGMYRPLLMLTFAFDYFLGGVRPYGYHLVNIFIHFLNAYLLYILLGYFLKGFNFSARLGLALLFCVHPLNTESVAYVSSRSILLGSLFVFAGFYAYLLWRESGNRRYYLLSVLSYAAALLTKETGLVFILLLAAYELVYAKDFTWETIQGVLRRLSVFFAVTFLYLALIKAVSGSVFGLFGTAKAASSVQRPFVSNILTQSAVSFFYLFLFFFPFNLCVDHAFPVISGFSNPAGAAGISLIIVIIGSALFMRKRLPAVSFALLWYFICLSPQFYARLNLVAAEHHSYAAFFGVYLIIAYFCAAGGKKISSMGAQAEIAAGKTIRLAFLFIFSLFSLLTVMRCFEWRNEYTLWKSTLRVNPHSGIAQGSIALNLISRGYIKEGLGYLEESVNSPAHSAVGVVSQLNLIYYQALLGDTQKAARMLEENKARFIKEFPFGYFKNLAVVYGKLGRHAEELQALETALRLIPESEEINNLLGWWYLNNSSDLRKAEEFFRISIRGNPDYFFSHLGLAGVLDKKGLYQEAIDEYKKVIAITPDSFEAYYNTGLIYARKLLRNEAGWYFKKCIELAPDFAPAYYNLCVFYLSLPEPDYKRARETFDKARELGYAVDKKIEELLEKKKGDGSIF
ncbi:MAG: tetratricopeptide repeat protein [Candidatus Omnitrophota bacterium]|jgi:tetratricopeptide (TPR) repeat protein